MTGGFFDPGKLETFKSPSADLGPRAVALFLIYDSHLREQLAAIKELIHRHRQAELAFQQNIEKLDAEIKAVPDDQNERSDQLDLDRADRLFESVFQDAAHSMSAVGMLAPFIESLFVAIFRKLREIGGRNDIKDKREKAAEDQFWNPQFAYMGGGWKDNLPHGIAQLATSIGLEPFLPTDYKKTLDALFCYRNNMFHNGFEWPLDKRKKFEQRIKSADWPSNWFAKALSGDDPWIFYMTPEFIEHCLHTIRQTLEAVGRFLQQERGPADQKP